LSSIAGSKGCSADSLSMNMRQIAPGVMPLARPAAIKPPALTPT
jgi:hypothetical protein